MIRRVFALPLLTALILGAAGCNGAKSTPPPNLDLPIPKEAAPAGGGKGKAPQPPSGKIN